MIDDATTIMLDTTIATTNATTTNTTTIATTTNVLQDHQLPLECLLEMTQVMKQ